MTHFSGAYIIIIIMNNIYEIIYRLRGNWGENSKFLDTHNFLLVFNLKKCLSSFGKYLSNLDKCWVLSKLFAKIEVCLTYLQISLYINSKTYVMCRCTPNAFSQKVHRHNFTNAKTRKGKTRREHKHSLLNQIEYLASSDSFKRLIDVRRLRQFH